jgi:hypothetical protein
MALAKQKPLYDPPTDYEDDFYQWCFEQAQLLRLKRFSEVDLPNVIEELESMGKGQESAQRASYRLVISHLLKWVHQPSHRSRSWSVTITRERNNIEEMEHANTGFAKASKRFVEEAYRAACREAAKETDLPLKTFPFECPFTPEQIRDHDWMPE